jgi:1-acyl-sn-glycerol-3-phosphate acyltransferase
MGIALHVEGKFPERGAVISNHTGYLDIVAIAALHPCVFVSKAELEEVPVLGWMTTMAGTVYVERGRGGSAKRATGAINAAAHAGVPLVFFPEGTTSNGTGVLPFRTGLLAKVLEAGEPVTAAFVRYRLTEANGPGVSVEDDVAFWGDDVSLFPHIFRLAGVRGVEVVVRIAQQPIAFTADWTDRDLAAAEARAAVMNLGGIHNATTAGH